MLPVRLCIRFIQVWGVIVLIAVPLVFAAAAFADSEGAATPAVPNRGGKNPSHAKETKAKASDAKEANKTKSAAPKSAGPLGGVAKKKLFSFMPELGWSLALVGGFKHDEVGGDSALNPDNAVLNLPANTGIAEVRPQLTARGKKYKLFIRPIARYSQGGDYHDKPPPDNPKSQGSLKEAYIQASPGGSLILALGRQHFLWGPAESVNPSNSMFHETAQDRGILYTPDGKDIVRVSFSVGQSFNLIVMSEVHENRDEQVFMTEEKFEPAALLKPEISWASGANYIGVVAGGRGGESPWGGLYFSIKAFPEGVSIYGDGAFRQGATGFYPVRRVYTDPRGYGFGQITMEHRLKDDLATYQYYVAGMRYDFVRGDIVRIEYLRYDAGYAKEDRRNIVEAFTSMGSHQTVLRSQNAERYLKNGQELPGKYFWFLSSFSPNVMTRDLTLGGRVIRSMTDGSLSAYASVDYAVGGSGTVSASAQVNNGTADSDLRGQINSSYIMACKWDF